MGELCEHDPSQAVHVLHHEITGERDGSRGTTKGLCRNHHGNIIARRLHGELRIPLIEFERADGAGYH